MIPQIILASGSTYRQELLSKLQIPFLSTASNIDESCHMNESPSSMVERLATEKAEALQTKYPDSWIIGSDQSVILEGRIFGKPGNYNNALEQLRQSSGKHVEILTGLCLLDSKNGNMLRTVEVCSIKLRNLTDSIIKNYLIREKPYDCAGSIKSEGLGITLIESITGNDPNSIIGLPLIRLCDFFEEWGLQLPLPQTG